MLSNTTNLQVISLSKSVCSLLIRRIWQVLWPTRKRLSLSMMAYWRLRSLILELGFSSTVKSYFLNHFQSWRKIKIWNSWKIAILEWDWHAVWRSFRNLEGISRLRKARGVSLILRFKFLLRKSSKMTWYLKETLRQIKTMNMSIWTKISFKNLIKNMRIKI